LGRKSASEKRKVRVDRMSVVKEKVSLETVTLIKVSGDPEKWREWNKKVLPVGRVKRWDTVLESHDNNAISDKMKSEALAFLSL